MEVKEIKNKEAWEQFLKKCKEKTFLDSWNWGSFQKKLGKKVWRLGIEAPSAKARRGKVASENSFFGQGFFSKKSLSGIAQVIKIEAKRGTFLFVPHGPVVKSQNLEIKSQVLKSLLKKLKVIAKKEKASFIRVGPIWERNEKNKEVFKKIDFREAPVFVHPEITLELDLEKPEREILKEMRKNTRYSIRKAKREGVKTFKSKKVKDINKFYELYKKVAKRKKFVPFSLNYIKKEFETFLPNQILLIFGEYKEKILSSAIVVFWQDRAFYHHGASNLKYSKIPISYPVQWEAIKEAKRRGCKIYNFWGVAPEDAKDHPYAGLTLFKTGFGGKRKRYVKTQDYPLSLKYWPTFVFEKLRRKKRGL